MGGKKFDIIHGSPPGIALDGDDFEMYQNAARIKSIDRVLAGRGGAVLGDIKLSMGLVTPSALHPWYNLSNADTVLSVANWPDLVPYLRALPLRYDPLNTNKTAFDVTTWAIAANVATLTFANTTAEQKILNGLAEDNLVHGSFVSWRSVTLPVAIGDIPEGDYAISAIDTVLRKISFTLVAGNNSGAGAFTVNFYAHRIEGSIITARHFPIQGRGFFTVMDGNSEWIGNLRRRDREQEHLHAVSITSGNQSGDHTHLTDLSHDHGPHQHYMPNGANYNGVGYVHRSDGSSLRPTTELTSATGVALGVTNKQSTGVTANHNHAVTGDSAVAKTDGVNGPPRTGPTTDARGVGIFAYVFGGTYIP